MLRKLIYDGAMDLLERVEKKGLDAGVLAWPGVFRSEAVAQVPADETLTPQTRAMVGARPPRERWDEMLVDLHGRPMRSLASINDIAALHEGTEVDMAELGTLFLKFLRWRQSRV